MSGLRLRRMFLNALVLVPIVVLGACNGPKDTPAPPTEGGTTPSNYSTPPTPNGHGQIQGEGVPAFTTVTLHKVSCDQLVSASVEATTTTSDAEGDFGFAEVSTSDHDFCITWDDGQRDCSCDWTTTPCTC